MQEICQFQSTFGKRQWNYYLFFLTFSHDPFEVNLWVFIVKFVFCFRRNKFKVIGMSWRVVSIKSSIDLTKIFGWLFGHLMRVFILGNFVVVGNLSSCLVQSRVI